MLFKNVNIVCLIGEQVINNRSTFQDRAEPCIIVEISKEEDLTSFTDLLKEEFDRLIELNKVKYENW